MIQLSADTSLLPPPGRPARVPTASGTPDFAALLTQAPGPVPTDTALPVFVEAGRPADPAASPASPMPEAGDGTMILVPLISPAAPALAATPPPAPAQGTVAAAPPTIDPRSAVEVTPITANTPIELPPATPAASRDHRLPAVRHHPANRQAAAVPGSDVPNAVALTDEDDVPHADVPVVRDLPVAADPMPPRDVSADLLPSPQGEAPVATAPVRDATVPATAGAPLPMIETEAVAGFIRAAPASPVARHAPTAKAPVLSEETLPKPPSTPIAATATSVMPTVAVPSSSRPAPHVQPVGQTSPALSIDTPRKNAPNDPVSAPSAAKSPDIVAENDRRPRTAATPSRLDAAVEGPRAPVFAPMEPSFTLVSSASPPAASSPALAPPVLPRPDRWSVSPAPRLTTAPPADPAPIVPAFTAMPTLAPVALPHPAPAIAPSTQVPLPSIAAAPTLLGATPVAGSSLEPALVPTATIATPAAGETSPPTIPASQPALPPPPPRSWTRPRIAGERIEPGDAPLVSLAAAPIPPATTPAAVAPIVDMRRDHWPHDMVAQIERLRDAADAADTRIRLVPDMLGRVEVDVRRDGDTLHVRFSAEQPQTRALLQEAQPRLAEAAEQRGLKLGQASVDAGAGAGTTGQQPQRQPAQPAPAQPRTPLSRTRPSDTPTDDARVA